MRTKFFPLFLLLTAHAGAVTVEGIKELIDTSSIDITIAKLEVEKSGLELEKTFRGYFPTVSLSAEFDEFYPAGLKNSWNQNYSLGFTVSATPLDFRRNVQLEIDRKVLRTDRYSVDEKRLSLYYQGIVYLLKLKALEKKIAFRKEIVRDSEEILKVAEDKYRKGLALITDVLKAKADLRDAKALLRKARLEYEQTFNELNELVNYTLPENERIEVELEESFQIPSVQELMKRALSMRPEILKAKENVKIFSLKAELVEKNLSPSLTLSASYLRNGSEFFPPDKNYRLSAVFSFPVFDSGVTKLGRMAELKEKEKAKLSLRKEKNRIKREVLNAVAGLKSNKESFESDRAFLKFARKSYERVFNEYKLGVSDIVALMQAHQNLKNAMERFVDSLLNLNISYYQLKKATGELLGEAK